MSLRTTKWAGPFTVLMKDLICHAAPPDDTQAPAAPSPRDEDEVSAARPRRSRKRLAALALALSVPVLIAAAVFWSMARIDERLHPAPYYILVGQSRHVTPLKNELKRIAQVGGEDVRSALEGVRLLHPKFTVHEFAMVIDTADTREEADQKRQRLTELGFRNVTVVREKDRFFELNWSESETGFALLE